MNSPRPLCCRLNMSMSTCGHGARTAAARTKVVAAENRLDGHESDLLALSLWPRRGRSTGVASTWRWRYSWSGGATLGQSGGASVADRCIFMVVDGSRAQMDSCRRVAHPPCSPHLRHRSIGLEAAWRPAPSKSTRTTHRASALRRHMAGGVSGSPRAVGWRQGAAPGASFWSGGVRRLRCIAGELPARLPSSPPAPRGRA